jgi:hypothetical protein
MLQICGMDIAATVSETATEGLAVLTCTTDKADVKFRGVLQDPEVLTPFAESLLRQFTEV